jgi:hypothetical protein
VKARAILWERDGEPLEMTGSEDGIVADADIWTTIARG